MTGTGPDPDPPGADVVGGDGHPRSGRRRRAHPDRDAWRPPHRLSDLSRVELRVALLIAALLIAPFLLSGARAVVGGWVPSGDEALIAIKTHDVFTADPPLVGQPSSSFAASGQEATFLSSETMFTFHPGPIEFWLFAPPVRLLGPEIGLLLGAGLVNGGAVLVAAWVVFRRAGRGPAAWAAVVLAAVCWSQGTAVLTDPISSSLGTFPFLAFCLLSWALVAGDLRLVPLAVLAGTWTAQQHLADVAPVAVVAAWAVIGLSVVLARWARRHDLDRWVAGRWLGAGGLVGVVAWAPVVVQQVTGDPGNITAIGRFARISERPTLGIDGGLDLVVRAVGPPPMFLRSGWSAAELRAPVAPLVAIGGLLVAVALIAAAASARRRRPDLALLAVTALVVAGAGLLTGANVPSNYLVEKLNLYRWVWTVAAVTWIAVGWAAGVLVRAAVARIPAPGLGSSRAGRLVLSAHRHAVVAVAVAMAMVLGAVAIDAAVGGGVDDERRDAALFGVEARTGTDLLEAVDGRGPWLVVADGLTANQSVAPSLASQLVAEGVGVQVRAGTEYYGVHRRDRPGTVAGAILVRSSTADLPAPPGRLVRAETLNPELDEAVGRLAREVGDAPEVVVAPGSEERLDELDPLARATATGLIDRLDVEPEVALGSPVVLQLLLDGYLSAPQLDRREVARALQRAEDRELWPWGDDHLSVWLLTPSELARWEADQARPR